MIHTLLVYDIGTGFCSRSLVDPIAAREELATAMRQNKKKKILAQKREKLSEKMSNISSHVDESDRRQNTLRLNGGEPLDSDSFLDQKLSE